MAVSETSVAVGGEQGGEERHADVGPGREGLQFEQVPTGSFHEYSRHTRWPPQAKTRRREGRIRPTGEQPYTLSGNTGAVLGVAFNPDGHLLATASYNMTA
jgi:WD40 repeat protein